MRRNGLFFLLAIVCVFLLRDARAHEDTDIWHWESAGTFDNGRSDINIHWDISTDDDPWGFGNVGYAQVQSGTSNAYWTGCFSLWVEGIQFEDSTYSLDFDDRGLHTTEEPADDLDVARELYIPEAGLDFIRYVDTFTNNSGIDGTFTIEYRCTMGSLLDISDEENFSSDGNATYDLSDTWVGSDIDGDTRPAVAFVIQSESAPVPVDDFPEVADGSGRTYWTYELDLADGETAALMVFGVQGQDEASVTLVADEIMELADDVMLHAEDDLDMIRNWVSAPPGAPVIRTNGPYNVDEGSTVRLGATVEDLEGDPVVFAWDLDDDGAFDDSFVLDPEVSASGIDGPTNLRVSLWASDGVNEVARRTTIRVRNVDPRITSDPPDTATTDEFYSYQITATDPAGVDDPFDYAVTGPSGMVVNDAGLVTWTPDEVDARIELNEVIVVVDDGDDGIDTQEFTVTLGGAPHVVSADEFDVNEGGQTRLEIEVTDTEGDPTTASWDLNRDGDFTDAEGTSAIFSAEGMDGPSDTFARVLVTDGEWDVIVRVDIRVRNAPPIFDSDPPSEARAGGTWEYTVVAHDPGGDPFELTVEEEDLPPGMTFDDVAGSFTWPVNDSHLADSPFSFQITADDDDDRSRQDVTIHVIDNYPPTAPRPIYPSMDSPSLIARPTLKAGNATDLDEDPLTYFFELDLDPGFRSMDLQESGAVAEGPGVTEWMVPNGLWDERQYYWRVWVNDGIDDSEKPVSVFEVQLTPVDAGPSEDDGGGGGGGGEEAAGCVCRSTGDPPSPFGWLALPATIGVLCWTRRRR